MGSSKDGEDDSTMKKHAGTSQKAKKGPDFSKLLVPIYSPQLQSNICMYTVLYWLRKGLIFLCEWRDKDLHVEIVVRRGRSCRVDACGTAACFGLDRDLGVAKRVRFENKKQWC